MLFDEQGIFTQQFDGSVSEGRGIVLMSFCTNHTTDTSLSTDYGDAFKTVLSTAETEEVKCDECWILYMCTMTLLGICSLKSMYTDGLSEHSL